MQLIQKFEQFYKSLSEDSLDHLEQIYHPEAELIDPITRHRGLTSIKGYFLALLENTQQCTCQIQHTAQLDDEFFVTWEMQIKHPKLNSGQIFSVEGVSHLRISDDRIRFHRDYYDLGDMVYERIPVLKHVIRSIKKRMS